MYCLQVHQQEHIHLHPNSVKSVLSVTNLHYLHRKDVSSVATVATRTVDMANPPTIIIRNGIINKITIELEQRDHIQTIVLSEIAPDCGIVYGINGDKYFEIKGNAQECDVVEPKRVD